MFPRVFTAVTLFLLAPQLSYSATVAEYQEQLRDVAKVLDRMVTIDPRSSEWGSALDTVKPPELHEVEADGQRVPMDPRWVKDALMAISKEQNPHRAQALLNELRNGVRLLESEVSGQAPEWPEVKSDLSQILEGLERQMKWKRRASLPWDLLLLLLRWLKELLRSTGLLKIALFGLYLCLLLVPIAILVSLWKKTERRPASQSVQAELGEGTATTQDSGALREQAQMHLSRGEYQLAIRCLHLSLLCLLAERGLIAFDPSKTNGEYVRMLQDKPSLHVVLRALTRRFDDIWYGTKTASLTLYQQFEQDYVKAQQAMSP